MIVRLGTIVQGVLTDKIVEQETIVREVFDQAAVQVNGLAVPLFQQIQNAHHVLKASSIQVLHNQLIHVKFVQTATGHHLVDQVHVVMHVEQDTIVREVFDQAAVRVSGRVILCFLQIQVAHNV